MFFLRKRVVTVYTVPNKGFGAIHKLISLEAISKPHLAPDGCVEGLFKMLTYSPCMLRFIIGPRLALERDLRLPSNAI
jgi:hypothetical protein